MSNKSRIAIFASGNGTNAEKIISYFQSHHAIEIALVICNNSDARVLKRAEQHNVPSYVLGKADFGDPEIILERLKEKSVTHLVLAGFLLLIPEFLIRSFPNKIINIHPALLPKYGGKGMYGMKVHEAVKRAGDRETGITIHLVNEQYDEGLILFQRKCDVLDTDTPEEISQKVHALEYESYAKEIENWIAHS